MKPGDHVEDFTLKDETGADRSLSEFLATGPVVLFFYPAAMTGGCTAESCHFRDLAAEFAAVGAHRIGISPDAVDKQAQFSTMHSFDYPLLSDPDGAVAKKFEVRRKFGPLLTKRKTFVIDTDGTVLEAVKSELRFNVHADRALEVLREKQSKTA
ncbi:peroxiredoxin [Actinokineospora sp. NBRC 105648]|uniref:peroxiredoxin n=1 Tax=Actinokineospora sp. NBRC 105648 TaxID=3032206 RepID=UPI0024A4316F|nr:peroxiredoxin [Actinokineospora sp. NBRC 105648]GLZ40253.1 peroxiredoxin [Actinokineospora sp. NBRC 105648]